MTKIQNSSDPVMGYIKENSLRLTPVQQKLIEVTKQHERARMLSSADEMQLLGNLCKHMGFKKTIDVGVFTGYSALTIAQSLPADGTVLACDVSEEFTNIGKQFWKEAGVADKIELVIAPAVETLQKRIDQGESGQYDFAFIDADKPNYDNYYEQCLKLIRPGGLIAIDNVLWGGSVADPSRNDESVNAIRAINTKIAKDSRVDVSMLRVGDGTTLAFKI